MKVALDRKFLSSKRISLNEFEMTLSRKETVFRDTERKGSFDSHVLVGPVYLQNNTEGCTEDRCYVRGCAELSDVELSDCLLGGICLHCGSIS